MKHGKLVGYQLFFCCTIGKKNVRCMKSLGWKIGTSGLGNGMSYVSSKFWLDRFKRIHLVTRFIE